jgi:protein-tyrosine phosphatase
LFKKLIISKEEFLDPLFGRIVYKESNKSLATFGIEEDKRQNINYINGYKVLDVRSLLDDTGNKDEDYYKLIDKGVYLLDNYDKVVVCCTAGISRSNAIAIGILMKYWKMDFQTAFEMVNNKISNCLIENAHINALKRLES